MMCTVATLQDPPATAGATGVAGTGEGSAPADSPVALPPGPRLPMPLQTLLWVLRPTWYMRRLQRRHGDAFTIRLPVGGPVVNVTHPDAIGDVFGGGSRVMHAGKANAVLEPLLGSHSVLLLDGAEHLRQRRLLLPAFHGERMRRYRGLIAEVTAAEVDTWRPGDTVVLRTAMQRITLDVILRAVFGVESGPRLDRARRVIRDLLDHGSRWQLMMFPPLRRDWRGLTPYGRFLRLRDRADAVVYDEIRRRRDDPDLAGRDDVLALLLSARDDDGRGLSDVELRDELMTLLVAGHETTATALAWWFDCVLRNPEVLRRVEAEMHAGGSAYLDASIRETLRHRPVVPVVARVLQDDADIAGMHLSRGTRVAPNIYLAHHRGDVHADPDSFQPERFLGGSPDGNTWLPFGGGVRRCLGAAFAVAEMRTVIPTVLGRVELQPARGTVERTVRRAVTFSPARGTPVRVVARRAPAGTLPTG